MEEIRGPAAHRRRGGRRGAGRARGARPPAAERRSSARSSRTATTTPTRIRATSCSTREGTLWLLDFGSVGRLDPVTLEALQGMAIGFSIRDGSVIARAVRHLVGDDRSDMRVLERDMSLLLGEAQGGGFSPAVLSGVLDVMERHGLRPPRAMLLLSRTLLTLEGTLKAHRPRVQPPGRGDGARRARGPRRHRHARGDPAARARPRAPLAAHASPSTPRRSPASFAAAG